MKQKNTKKIAIIGAGWAGLTAAIALTQKGMQVSIFEAAPQTGGRARTVLWKSQGQTLEIDNGQHILVGAYHNALSLLKQIGIPTETVLQRLPFGLPLPEGWKLKAAPLPAPLHLLTALFRSNYSAAQRRQLLSFAYRIISQAYKPGLTVQQWLGDLQGPIWDELIEPLCVAALNTPAQQACAYRFAVTLRKTLLASSTASNFLIPKVGLSDLFCKQAQQWLTNHGAQIFLSSPVRTLTIKAAQVEINETLFDTAIVATGAHIARHLIAQADLQARLASLNFEPIATSYLRLAQTSSSFRLPAPMIALPSKLYGYEFAHSLNSAATGLGHWAFLRQIATKEGQTVPVLAVVSSAARDALNLSRDQWLDNICMQVRNIWPQLPDITDSMLIVEKRATFSCTPFAAGLGNATNNPRVFLAGDYTEAQLPATLESAVISGHKAAQQVLASHFMH